MSRFILGCLALCALALVIGPTVAENPQQANWQFADNSAANNSNGVVIIETYSTSSLPTPQNSDMQPLPGDPGVEVAPNNNDTFASSSQPVMVEEEDMLVQENE